MRVDDKGEILSAYRNIPVHADDRALIAWHGMGRSAIRGYSTTVWPRVGPKIFRLGPEDFSAVADAAQWIAENQGSKHCCIISMISYNYRGS